MKSAYTVLGIPGNASTPDIELAYQKAAAHYSHERIGDDTALADKLVEVQQAYKLLSNADMRAAHDRKLSTAVARPVQRERIVVEDVAPAWYTRPMVLLALVVVAMFGVGSYMGYSRDQTRKALAAQELAQKKLETEEAARAESERARIDTEKARALAAEQNRDRQLRAESNSIANRAASQEIQQLAMMNRQIEADRREAQRKEQQTRADELQRVADGRRQLASDQARIRELCWQQYKRANC